MPETLTIDHVGSRGDGVAVTSGAPRYVPFTLPGECVEVDTGAGERVLPMRIVSPSPERIVPFCPHFGSCGGCAIQHWQHDAYLTWKRDLVVTTLAHAGISAEVAPIVDAHGEGRRRATFHARRGADGAVNVGFAAAQSYAIVPIEKCPILDPRMSGALESARAIAEALAPVGKSLDIQVTAVEQGLDVDVRGSGPLPANLVTKLSALARQHRLARLTRHGELIVQTMPPTVTMGRANVPLPAGSFLQATRDGEDALASQILKLTHAAKSIADLFCGVGPFALRMAENAKVAAYDSETNAIAALNKAAALTPKLKPVAAHTRDLFRRPLVPAELSDFDAVVFDPPRQGAEAQAMQIAKSKVRTVIAVSCNAATFARDAAILIGGGYKIGTVMPVDQFRHSPHVELVADFHR